MKMGQALIEASGPSLPEFPALAEIVPDLILVFGAVSYFSTPGFHQSLRERFPGAAIAGCSTAGEIHGSRVLDGSASITAIEFEKTTALVRSTNITAMSDSFEAVARVAAALPIADLTAVLVFGTGLAINGSALVAGLQSNLPTGTKISGGLAGDDGAFCRTWTMGSDGAAHDQIVVVGLYGKHLHFSCGSFGGWAAFGPARKVTRCQENILFELDGECALDIYKRYLGDHAEKLPASGLLFPFEMLSANEEPLGVYRTILGIDETTGSLTLAGEIDPGGYLKLMYAHTDKLIDGAESAAAMAIEDQSPHPDDTLAILVSCIGRKLILGDRVEEEVEAVAHQLPAATTITGFYSNGEISSTSLHGGCRLHNQTMTISLIHER